MTWQEQLQGDSPAWLLEYEDAGVRYLAVRHLLDLAHDDPKLTTARDAAHQDGHIPAILAEMQPEGYWEKPGAGYNPKYRSSVWSIILLAQLGAHMECDPRLERACDYMLEHALTEGGQFSANGTPSYTIDCLQGNLCASLIDLGADPARLDKAYEWMARTVTGEGLAPNSDKKAPLRYYAYKCGPNFACGANYTQPCAWGAVKVMLGFGRLPPVKRTPLIEDAIAQGISFLLGTDPAGANYPSGVNDNSSTNWWKFGFPVFYVTDILQIVEALLPLGCGSDPRLSKALDLIRSKQDPQGRWILEYDYKGKTWGDYGTKKQPNPWVTLRALRALKTAYQADTTN